METNKVELGGGKLLRPAVIRAPFRGWRYFLELERNGLDHVITSSQGGRQREGVEASKGGGSAAVCC